MKWIKASERLPDMKKYYSCKLNGLPVIYWIDKKNDVIVLTGGTLIGKSMWDQIVWLDESSSQLTNQQVGGLSAEPTHGELFEALENQYSADPLQDLLERMKAVRKLFKATGEAAGVELPLDGYFYNYKDGRKVKVIQVIIKTRRAEVIIGEWNPFWVNFTDLSNLPPAQPASNQVNKI